MDLLIQQEGARGIEELQQYYLLERAFQGYLGTIGKPKEHSVVVRMEEYMLLLGVFQDASLSPQQCV